MPRAPRLGHDEVSFVKRVRAPTWIIERLLQMTPAERGAWIYHADQWALKHAPEHSLEYPPKPIPKGAYRKKRPSQANSR